MLFSIFAYSLKYSIMQDYSFNFSESHLKLFANIVYINKHRLYIITKTHTCNMKIIKLKF